MAKDYICKDCTNNNHGWCNVLKRNKLKEIETCTNKNKTINSIDTQTPQDKEVLNESYRVLGKREMLWNIQKQAIAIKNDNTIADYLKFELLCNCLNSIAQMQEYSEELYNVKDIIDSEIDQMMIIDSKNINQVL